MILRVNICIIVLYCVYNFIYFRMSRCVTNVLQNALFRVSEAPCSSVALTIIRVPPIIAFLLLQTGHEMSLPLLGAAATSLIFSTSEKLVASHRLFFRLYLMKMTESLTESCLFCVTCII